MKKIEIYSKNDCNYCTLIKDLFNFHKNSYIEYNLSDGNVSKDDIQERVGDLKKINTVPQVFIDGEFIGGYLDILNYYAYDKHNENITHK